MFAYTHFKSSDQSLDKTSFDLSNIFRAMQSCAMSGKIGVLAGNRSFTKKTEYKNCDDNHVDIQKRHSKFDNSKNITTFPVKTIR